MVTLAVIDSRTRRRLVQVSDVDSFVWVPQHGHRLVVATGGIYAAALLDMWDGGIHWRSLCPVRRPDDECFVLYGATRDGGGIVYGHSLDLEKDGAALDRQRWLRLPPGE